MISDDDAEGQRYASRRVAAVLEAQIEAGKYPPGTQLPPYRQIAADNGIATNTAQAAVRVLQAKGYVTIKPSSGAYVRDRSEVSPGEMAEQLRAALTEARDQIHRSGLDLAETEQVLTTLLDALTTDRSPGRSDSV